MRACNAMAAASGGRGKVTSLRHDISRVTISDLIRNVLQISGTGTNDEDLTEG